VVGGTYVYGTSPIGVIGTTRTMAFNPDSLTWSLRDTMAFARWYPTVTTLGDGRVLASGGRRHHRLTVFGGRDSSGALSNDLRSVGLGEFHDWDSDASSGAARPLPREGHSFVYYRPHQRYFVWGGILDSGAPASAETLYYARAHSDDDQRNYDWESVRTTGDPTHGYPRARGWHGSALRGDTLVIHGGRAEADSGFSDAWMLVGLSTTTPQWVKLVPYGEVPSGRYLHAAAIDPGFNDAKCSVPLLVVHGGREDGSTLAPDDVWTLKLPPAPPCDTAGTPAWEKLDLSQSPDDPPTAREGHVAVLDQVLRPDDSDHTRRRIYFHGGRIAGPELDDGLWMLYRGDTPGDTVASVIALASGSRAASASWNQRSNCANGSASASASARPARMYSWRRSAMFIESRF